MPAPTFLECLDLCKSCGHDYPQMAKQVIEPLGEAGLNLDVFREMARRCGFADSCFNETEIDTMRQALNSMSEFLAGIDVERLMSGGPVRVNLPADVDPFARDFHTPSDKIKFYSDRTARLAYDPRPAYHACTESPENAALHERFPLQLLVPPSVHLLNSTFGAVEEERRRVDPPSLKIHPANAAKARMFSSPRTSPTLVEARLFTAPSQK